MRRTTGYLLVGAALALGTAARPAPALAQHGPLAMNAEFARAGGDDALKLSKSLARGGYAVVIDLDANELTFRQGRTVLWRAPIGTGTGLRLETEDQEWDFSTPNGVFQVQYKERNPTWIAPDWYFIENDLPIPPPGDKKRLFPGGLGAAAVYIGHDLAIHGTDKPELLGQRVSHGCIRLSDKDALRLFHNVQTGTEVVIVGGERVRRELADAGANGNDPSTFNPKPKPKPKDPLLERWKAMDTDDLVDVLRDEVWIPGETTRWTEVAALLLARGLDGDEEAISGLLRGVGDLPNGRVEAEYGTFLADAFSRGAKRTLAVLSDLPRRDRDRAAAAIVDAMMGLYGGDLEAQTTPWPTRRISEAAIGREARLGWNALQRAERDYRDRGPEREI